VASSFARSESVKLIFDSNNLCSGDDLGGGKHSDVVSSISPADLMTFN